MAKRKVESEKWACRFREIKMLTKLFQMYTTQSRINKPIYLWMFGLPGRSGGVKHKVASQKVKRSNIAVWNLMFCLCNESVLFKLVTKCHLTNMQWNVELKCHLEYYNNGDQRSGTIHGALSLPGYLLALLRKLDDFRQGVGGIFSSDTDAKISLRSWVIHPSPPHTLPKHKTCNFGTNIQIHGAKIQSFDTNSK